MLYTSTGQPAAPLEFSSRPGQGRWSHSHKATPRHIPFTILRADYKEGRPEWRHGPRLSGPSLCVCVGCSQRSGSAARAAIIAGARARSSSSAWNTSSGVDHLAKSVEVDSAIDLGFGGIVVAKNKRHQSGSLV